MSSGQFITNRILPTCVIAACEQLGIGCASFSDEWVLRLEKNQQISFVIGYQFGLNTSTASSVANDKVAASLILLAQKVPVLPHVLVRSVLGQKIDENYLRTQLPTDEPCVIKPLIGSGAIGVQKVNNLDQAINLITTSPEPAWAVSPLKNIVQEVRLVLLDNQVLLAYDKKDPAVRNGLKLFNLGLGTRPVDIKTDEIDSRLLTIAQNARQALSLRLCAVDIARDLTGDLFVMEVNSGIMMENYARVSEEHRKRVDEVYATIVKQLF